MSVLSVTLQCFECKCTANRQNNYNFSSKKKRDGVQQLIYVNNYWLKSVFLMQRQGWFEQIDIPLHRKQTK